MFLFSAKSFALPTDIEVWFLSANKTAFLEKHLVPFTFSSLLAENEQYDCQPMGDGCFHPQLGFIDKKPQEVSPEKKGDEEVKLKTFNATETNMIDCDKGQYFDIFCGKEKIEKVVTPKLEIWVDTSSSLREVDYSKELNFCERRTFVSKVMASCTGESVRISVFDTSLKEMGDTSSLCINYGLNDQKRLMDWIQGSEAKKLIIITDISEYSREFSVFLESVGAKTKGADTDVIMAHDLSTYADDLIKVCKK